MLLLALTGCLDAILEAPFVLSTGLTEVRSITPSGRTTMLAATPGGVVEIDGSGAHTLLSTHPARAIAAHATVIYLLTDDALLWGAMPPPGERIGALSHISVAGVVDIQSWCHGQVLLAGAAGLQTFDSSSGMLSPYPAKLPPLKSVSLPAEAPCTGAVVASADAVIEVIGEELRSLPVDTPRVVTPGRDGHTWLIHGTPPILSRMQDGTLSLRAEHIGNPLDAHFGTGELFSPSNIYFADAAGTLDYARVIDDASR
ncbi:MAG: hypothetical protein P8R54_17665 [Myxococcota bacterium]|nr:hypothetical protein [Myxococcota bacterium]